MKSLLNFSRVLFLSILLVTVSFVAKAEGEDSFFKVENQDLTAWKNIDTRTSGSLPSLLPGQKLETASNGNVQVTDATIAESVSVTLPVDISSVNTEKISQ